jgi:acyl-CoA thioesterase-1
VAKRAKIEGVERAGEVMRYSRRQATYGILGVVVQAFAFFAAFDMAQAKTLNLVALGDSLTSGYGVKPGQRFPEVLEKALRAKGHDVHVINAGVSGETAQDGLMRFDWSVPADTNALIVELGANDMLRGMPVEGAKRALSAILSKATQQHIPTLLAGMKAAPNLGPEYRAAYDRIFPDLARQYSVDLYPFFLDGVAADPKLIQPDGLHPNPEGVKIIVERILPAVEALLAKAK